MLWAVENTATVVVTTMVSMQEKEQSVIWLAEENPLQQCSKIFYSMMEDRQKAICVIFTHLGVVKVAYTISSDSTYAIPWISSK